MTPHKIPYIHDDGLIFASTWTTCKQLPLLQFLFLKFNRKNVVDNMIEVSYSELESIDVNWKEEIKSLFSISFTVTDENNRKLNFHWIERMVYKEKEKILCYRLSNPVEDALLYMQRYYSEDYNGLIYFTRYTSYKIYKHIKSLRKDYEPVFTTCQKMMDECDFEEWKEKRIADFKRFVLKNAINDINQYLNWNMNLDSYRSHLTFTF